MHRVLLAVYQTWLGLVSARIRYTSTCLGSSSYAFQQSLRLVSSRIIVLPFHFTFGVGWSL